MELVIILLSPRYLVPVDAAGITTAIWVVCLLYKQTSSQDLKGMADMVQQVVSYVFGVIQGCAQDNNVGLSKWNYMTWTDTHSEVNYLYFSNMSTLMISHQ